MHSIHPFVCLCICVSLTLIVVLFPIEKSNYTVCERIMWFICYAFLVSLKTFVQVSILLLFVAQVQIVLKHWKHSKFHIDFYYYYYCLMEFASVEAHTHTQKNTKFNLFRFDSFRFNLILHLTCESFLPLGMWWYSNHACQMISNFDVEAFTLQSFVDRTTDRPTDRTIECSIREIANCLRVFWISYIF